MKSEEPDITVEEALNNGEEDEHSLSQKEVDEMKAEYEKMREGALILVQSSALGEMLIRSEITLKEYDRLTETLFKIANEKGVPIP